jgi:large-conductance mechanosensitive channel
MVMKREMKLFGLFGLLFIAFILAGAFAAAADGVSQGDLVPNLNLTVNQSAVVQIPAVVQDIARLVFKLEGKSVDFSDLVILIVLWFFAFLIIKNLLEIVPFFGKGWKSWIGGIIATLLTSISGGITQGGFLILGIADSIKWLDKSGGAKFAFVVLFLVIIGYAILFLLKMLKNKIDVEKAKETGASIKRGSESADLFSKMINILAGNEVK